MPKLVRGLVTHTRPPSPHFARTDPLDRGLVGEWRFDRPTGLMLPDYSGYSRHGSVTGATWITGQFGPGLHFVNNTSTYVDSFSVPVSLPLSFEFLAYPTSATSYRGVLGTIGAGDLWYITCETDMVRIRHNSINRTLIYTATGIHHYIFAEDAAGNWTWYLDGGVLTASGSSGDEASWGNFAEIGRFWSSNAYTFDGDIFLIRAYDRAITASEDAARYQIVRRRMQELGGVWVIPWGKAAAGLSIPVAMDHYRKLRIRG